ncbi:MAG: glutamate racemase [Geodermatophilaceae bacterium]|nr:glutamate racemase [Geodermatophilaceae bacterium]
MTGAAAPIGVFDSGVGGLTVARAIMDQLPAESIRYLGDTAHSPYGPQPIADVRAHALAAMDQLVESGVKMLVVACNSASAACLRDARERYDVPVVEVILPAVRRAIAATRTGNVGVIGTQTTVRSRAYDDAFAAAPQVRITSAACPSFVDFVERGITSGRQILGLAQSYLEPLQRAEVDTLVLGCTHYPMLTGAISHVMGDGVTLVSSAEETAKDVFRVLTDEGLLRDGADPSGEREDRDPSADAVSLGEHRFFSTGDADTFHRLAERFLGPAVGPIATLPVGQSSAKAAEDTETRLGSDAATSPDTTPDGRAVTVPGQYSADRIPVPNAGATQ